MIEPAIRRLSAVDSCAKLLREAIVEGDLSPGEKLLPERELARRLGVNRVTVRSALERLSFSRLLDVRQGSGYRVRDFRRHGGPELILSLLGATPKRRRLREVARDLLLVRRALLRLAIEGMAETGRREDRVRLQEAVHRLAAAEDPEEIMRQDRIAIDAILDASGSGVVALCLNPILAVIARLPQLREAMAKDPRGNLDAFGLLLRGLSKGGDRWVGDVMAELSRRDLVVLSHLKKR